jgi:hypothetical protein
MLFNLNSDYFSISLKSYVSLAHRYWYVAVYVCVIWRNQYWYVAVYVCVIWRNQYWYVAVYVCVIWRNQYWYVGVYVCVIWRNTNTGNIRLTLCTSKCKWRLQEYKNVTNLLCLLRAFRKMYSLHIHEIRSLTCKRNKWEIWF